MRDDSATGACFGGVEGDFKGEEPAVGCEFDCVMVTISGGGLSVNGNCSNLSRTLEPKNFPWTGHLP